MEGFPEADPDVEQTQTAAQATKKSGGDQSSKPGIGKQKVVVGPLGSPRQNQQQNPGHGTNQHEKEDGRAMQPKLHAAVRLRRQAGRWRVEQGRAGVSLRCCGLRGRGWPILDRSLRISHSPLRCRRAEVVRGWRMASPSAARRKYGTKPIGLFYDFRGLMRSATSR
jgi:hypothetical protein